MRRLTTPLPCAALFLLLAACSSASEAEPPAAAPLTDSERAQLATALSDQAASPGDVLLTAPATAAGVASWTVYLGPLGFTAVGTAANGRTAALLAIQLGDGGSLAGAECALAADLGTDCRGAARALADDLLTASAGQAHPKTEVISSVSQDCKNGFSQLLHELNVKTQSPPLSIACNPATPDPSRVSKLAVPEGSCAAMARDRTDTAPLPGTANACCPTQPNHDDAAGVVRLVEGTVWLFCRSQH